MTGSTTEGETTVDGHGPWTNGNGSAVTVAVEGYGTTDWLRTAVNGYDRDRGLPPVVYVSLG